MELQQQRQNTENGLLRDFLPEDIFQDLQKTTQVEPNTAVWWRKSAKSEDA